MPAPKLLPKRQVNVELATQRKQDIDKGLKLVKSIEALQETREQEEKQLEDFRSLTITRVQIDIDTKIREREQLELGNKQLRKERVLAQAPLNLREEWLKVREERIANESWQDKNTQHSLELLAKEDDLKNLSEKLYKEQELIAEEHKLSSQTLKESVDKFTQADQAFERAEKNAQETLQNAHEIENRIKIREEDATLREIDLSKREEQVMTHEIDLSRREQKLKSRQETFMRATAYIKSKK